VLARQTGLPRSLLGRENRRIAAAAAEAAALQASELAYEEEEKALVAGIAEFVRTQAGNLHDMARELAVEFD